MGAVMRPLTDNQLATLAPLGIGGVGFGCSKRDALPLIRRGLAVIVNGMIIATPTGRDLVQHQRTRLLVMRRTGIWAGLRAIR